MIKKDMVLPKVGVGDEETGFTGLSRADKDDAVLPQSVREKTSPTRLRAQLEAKLKRVSDSFCRRAGESGERAA